VELLEFFEAPVNNKSDKFLPKLIRGIEGSNVRFHSNTVQCVLTLDIKLGRARRVSDFELSKMEVGKGKREKGKGKKKGKGKREKGKGEKDLGIRKEKKKKKPSQGFHPLFLGL